ncbi:MAG TPA: hypothetical protein VM076_10250 [Gemmatimonadaceae bacterium]|nr:hypothetical protein [Gemmatimonadaceae bacterium]
MSRLALVAALSIAATTSVAAQAPRTPRDSAVAAVNEFFRAMATRDTALTNRVQFADGVSFAVRAVGDTFAISRRGNEGWIRQLATMRDTVVERMWNPVVQVHGPIATVWAPYDIHRNRQFVHCGVDAFTLIRTSSGWKIASVAYTAEPTGCAPSPLGALP